MQCALLYLVSYDVVHPSGFALDVVPGFWEGGCAIARNDAGYRVSISVPARRKVVRSGGLQLVKEI